MKKITEILQEFARTKKARYNQNTADCYTAFAQAKGDLTVNSVRLDVGDQERTRRISRTTRKWNSFLEYMQRQKLAPSTQRQRLGILSSAIKWFTEQTYIPVYAKTPSVHVADSDLHVPIKVIQDILEYNPDSLDSRSTDFLFMAKLQIVTALRISDVSRITIDNLTGDVLRIRNSKTSVSTIHPIPASIIDPLRQRLEAGGLFRNMKLRRLSLNSLTRAYNRSLPKILAGVESLSQDAEILQQDPKGAVSVTTTTYLEQITSHMMRHFSATYYAWKGLSKDVLCAMGGWSANSTVLDKIYKHTAPDAVRSAVLNVYA